jgi:hypothetical protein
MTDEPLFDTGGPKRADSAAQGRQLAERIHVLVREQPYAVLCTQGRGQPYGSLVAFAMTDDLKSALFATPISTRKFRLLRECDHVALVIDSRARSSDDMMDIEAVTATGRAVQVAAGYEFDTCSATLVGRHPQLSAFVRSPTTALFRIDIVRYFHVSRFQEVRQWIPGRG